MSGIAAVGLLAAGLIASAPAPAYAAGNTVSVQDSGALQFIVRCDSQGTCNAITVGPLLIQFNRTGSFSKAQGIFYKITNGTAVDGRDFNIPATGEVTIPAGQFNTDLSVPLVYEGLFNATQGFAITITGTSPLATVTQGTATALISGGTMPPDCSFTWISSSSQSVTCTGRSAAQAWHSQFCWRCWLARRRRRTPSCWWYLRHEVAVLRRQTPGPKLDWADRAVLAALGPPATEATASGAAGDAGHAAALAPAAGPLAVDLSAQGMTAVH